MKKHKNKKEVTKKTMHQTIKIWRIKTSKRELLDLTKAWIAISLAFAFVYSGIKILGGSFSLTDIFSLEFLRIFGMSLLTAGVGFLFHEMAHKFTAQHYNCVAEFRAFDQMLYLAVGLAFFLGFIFAAPGAVMISGQITRRENGVISFAGPITNYILALIFFFLAINVSNLFALGLFINIWLGLFNLIPFGNFDGIKIFHWNKYLWAGMVAFGIFVLYLIGSF